MLPVQCRQTPPPNAPVSPRDWGRAGPQVSPSPPPPAPLPTGSIAFFLPSAATLHLISDTGAATLLCRQNTNSKKKTKKKKLSFFEETLYAVVKTLPLLTSSQRSLSWCHFCFSFILVVPRTSCCLCVGFYSCTVPCHCAVMPVVRQKKKEKKIKH